MVRVPPPLVPWPHTDNLSAVLAGGCSWVPLVTSSRGDSDPVDVPVVGGKVVYSQDADAQVIVTVEVPRRTPGVDWRPGRDPDHPLAAYGQVLSVAVEVSAPPLVSEVVQVATVQVESWREVSAGRVEVTGYGLLRRVVDAAFFAPLAARSGGTFGTELTRMFSGLLPVVVDAALVDRAVPDGMPLGTDRMAAVRDLLTAWPARLLLDPWGVAWVVPPLGEVPHPTARLTDGVGGTVVGSAQSGERRPNRVIVRGEAATEERASVQAMAQVQSGPMSVSGPYGVVTDEYSSALVKTRAECVDAALARLGEVTRARRTVPVTCAPDPRITLDLPVEVRSRGDVVWGWVSGYELPLVVGSGPMRLDVEVPA